jgi:hypothetical protein
MSETAHAEDGIDFRGKRFYFETCEEIGWHGDPHNFGGITLTDDDIVPLCANLGRFKRLKKIGLVSGGVCARGAGGAEGRRGGVALRLKA